MELRRLPAEEAAVRRYVEELWLPYHRELEATVDAHGLADDVDIVGEEVEFRLDRLESADYRAWVAVEDESDRADAPGDADLADAELAGFVTTEVEESPSVFDYADRLVVGDIYIREPYRGTGLARDLIDRAVERAREAGCPELTLTVDSDNERATAFYEKLGFETYRRQMKVRADGL